MKPDITDFLEDILKYSEMARQIKETTSLAVLSSFSPESLALSKALEVIGEAVKQIPETTRSNYPEIPWSQIARLRDKLIHHYWNTEMTRLIDIVENHLPDLERVVKQILEDYNLEE